jgi:anti-sigma factor RsiW
VRERWWGASGRQVPELVAEGDPALPLDEALVVDDVDDVEPLRAAFEEGRPVVVRATSAEQVKAALARPEVASVVVPPDRGDLLELDLTELTYG